MQRIETVIKPKPAGCRGNRAGQDGCGIRAQGAAEDLRERYGCGAGRKRDHRGRTHRRGRRWQDSRLPNYRGVEDSRWRKKRISRVNVWISRTYRRHEIVLMNVIEFLSPKQRWPSVGRYFLVHGCVKAVLRQRALRRQAERRCLILMQRLVVRYTFLSSIGRFWAGHGVCYGRVAALQARALLPQRQ